jgi:aminoglycoside phosphotransferase (APT) family kinase protein
MQLNAPWLKPAVWGAIVGSVITMIVGFSWMGWVLGATAERMAVERTNAAVVVALTPSCVSRFMQQPNAAAKLKELRTIDSWKQREFVEAGGWATSSGEKGPNSGVANACAEQLIKAKT